MSEAIFHRIYDVVRQIPQGQVASYGQVAMVVGDAVTARQVGDAMAALRNHHPPPPVPWQRVINAQGKVSTGPRQQALLEAEGVIFNAKGHTDLHRFSWRGPDADWAMAHNFHVLEEPNPSNQQLGLF
jgi:methylated-DNA-protein-cysteine methyltransferase-like protein